MARPRNKGATRRGYLKKWSAASIQTPETVSRFKVAEHPIFQTRIRAKGIGEPLPETRTKVGVCTCPPAPLCRCYRDGQRKYCAIMCESKVCKCPPKAVVNRQELLIDAPSWSHFVVFKGRCETVKLFFNNEGIFFFLKEDVASVSRSITYGSKVRAMEVYEQKKVVWVETRLS